MTARPKTSPSEKALLGILLAVLAVVLALSSARDRLVSSLIHQAFATSTTEARP